MITGVQDVYYNVKDMKRSIDFYSKTLGMKINFSDDYWASLNAWGMNIGLHWTEGGEIPKTPRDSHGQHCGATLTLISNDISKDKSNLEDAGAAILGESDAPWGYMLVFEDPDGNVLKLMNPKY